MSLAWSSDGTRLASASRDKTSKLFDTKTGESLMTFNGHAQPVSGVGFLAKNAQIVTSGQDRKLRVWNVKDGKQAREMAGFGGEIYQLSILPSNQVLSSSADKTARLHQAANGKVEKTFSGHTDWVYCAAIHAESKRVATGSYDGEIRIWNLGDGKLIQSFPAAPGYSSSPKPMVKP